MIHAVLTAIPPGVESIINQTATGIKAAIPTLIVAILLLPLAYVAIKIALAIVRTVLTRVYGREQKLVADLLTTVVGVFLWFGVGLTVLKIVGMGDIAASLGTAAGFIALGVSYALSNMIADTVAGVYLLRDPDFNPGDRVTTGSITGTVQTIELRKSRFELDDGDIVVLANHEVEQRWTKQASSDPSSEH